MRLEHFISRTISQVIGRLMRRLVAMAALALFVLAAIYHLSVAGTIELETLYGPLPARLIVAGVDLLVAILIFGGLYLTRAKPLLVKPRPSVSRAAQDAKMAMLLESILLGFSASRTKSR